MMSRVPIWIACLSLFMLGQLMALPVARALDVSPRGDLVAFINWETQPQPPIEIWQTKPLARIRRIYPAHPCWNPSFSQDGKIIVKCGLVAHPHALRVYDPLSGEMLRNLTQSAPITPDAFSLSADRRSAFFIGFGQERHVYRVALDTGKLSRLELEHQVFGTPAMSPDQSLLLVAGSGRMEALDTTQLKPRYKGPILQRFDLPSVCFSHDSRFAVLRSPTPGHVQIWALHNPNTWLSWQSYRIHSSCIDRQGRLALSDGYRIWILSLDQKRVLASRQILPKGSTLAMQAVEWLGDKLLINIAQELQIVDPKAWQDTGVPLPPREKNP